MRGAPTPGLDLDLVVPVRDEAAGLEVFVARLLEVAHDAELRLRLLLVVDRSSDDTAGLADRLSASHPQQVRVLHRGSSTGLGRAYLAGFAHVLAERGGAAVIGQMDADLSHDPAALPAMLEAMRREGAAAVIGSRWVAGGSLDPRWAAHRKALSGAANRLVVPALLGLGLTDPTSGFRLWRREALIALDPVRRVRAVGYGFQVEMALLAVRSGLRVIEWPIHFREREHGRSKMTAPVQLRAVAEIGFIALRHRVRPGLAATALLVGVVFCVYAATLHPSVPGGDSGELIAAAWTWGVAHPPGYPLYTIAAKAWSTALPWNQPAWRVNLFTAACAAAAAGLLFRFVAGLTGSRAAAVVAALGFAFSPLAWSWAVAAEVFALNNLFAAALLCVAARWAQAKQTGWAVFGAGLLGLGLTNHHTLVLLGVPLACWMLWCDRRLLRPKQLVVLLGAGALGLLPYAYLPLAALGDPPIVWGDWSGPQSLLHHLLRRDYGTLRLAGDIPAGTLFFAQLELYLRSLAQNTLHVGLLLAAVGAFLAWRARGLARMLVLAWLVYVVVFHYAANLPVRDPLYREITARFWQQPNLLVFACIGLGYAAIERRLGLSARTGLAVVLALVAIQAAWNWTAQDESANRHVADYGHALLDPLPPDAVLLTRGDLVTNVVRYLQECEGQRTDVVVLDQELLTRPWYVAAVLRRHPELAFPGRFWDPRAEGSFTLGEWIEANRTARPVWVYPEFKEGDPSVARGYRLWPVGLPSRVAPAAEPPFDFDGWRAESRRALERLRTFRWPDPGHYPPGRWEHVVLEDLWHASNRRATVLLEEALARGDDLDLLAEARQELETVAREHPAPPWFVYKNLGLALDRLRVTDPGLLAARDEAWRAYLRLAPPDEPARAAIAAAVRGF